MHKPHSLTIHVKIVQQGKKQGKGPQITCHDKTDKLNRQQLTNVLKTRGQQKLHNNEIGNHFNLPNFKDGWAGGQTMMNDNKKIGTLQPTDHHMFLDNCPLTPLPPSQHFALSEKEVLIMAQGRGGLRPRLPFLFLSQWKTTLVSCPVIA